MNIPELIASQSYGFLIAHSLVDTKILFQDEYIQFHW